MSDLELQLDREAAPKLAPLLDPEFRPAARWVKAFQARAAAAGAVPVGLALGRPDGTVYRYATTIFPWSDATAAVNRRHVERIIKYILWQKGGSRVWLSGCPQLASELARDYAADGARAFDANLMGNQVFGETFRVIACHPDELPAPKEPTVTIGGNWKGCRIGFDLGGSDRKCAAVIDGQTVFSDEVPWAPIKETDWHYHWNGIEDSLKRAAAHLPRIDAIGGSSAGIVVNNEIRAASLFRGVPKADFDRHVSTLFAALSAKWKVPVVVMNDGEVTALAGAMGLHDNPVLGMAFGTSLASGYCTPQGTLTSWLNELAFVPVDYRLNNAPRDEWSGDVGCGALYLSQQAVGRLASRAGIDFPENVGLADRLAETQKRLLAGDKGARQIFETIGRYLGYAVAHNNNFFDLKRILILGRVTSGDAGSILIEEAHRVLEAEFPEVAARVSISMPGEKEKRHGQAMVAASLPEVK